MDTDQAGKEAGFKNRRTGLKVFGGLAILIGCMSGCLAILTPVAMVAGKLAPDQEAAAPDPRGLVFGLLLYAALAVLFIWTGIGSIQGRRWVRPIMVVLAWTWL